MEWEEFHTVPTGGCFTVSGYSHLIGRHATKIPRFEVFHVFHGSEVLVWQKPTWSCMKRKRVLKLQVKYFKIS